MRADHDLYGAAGKRPARHVDEIGPASAWIDHAVVEVVRRPLPVWERLWNRAAVRRGVILVLLAAAWEASAHWPGAALLLPSLSDALAALWTDVPNGLLPLRMLQSLHTLALGVAIGVACALPLAAAAASSRIGGDLLAVLAGVLGSLPAITLMPVALLRFGAGEPAVVAILVAAILWPVASGAASGLQGVPDALRMAGRSLGLGPVRYALLWLVPAAFPAILGGMRAGWVLAWSTQIAAEMAFGAATGSHGIGWYIRESHARLDTPRVFAGLLSAVVLGALVESGFRFAEHRTVRRLGGGINAMEGETL